MSLARRQFLIGLGVFATRLARGAGLEQVEVFISGDDGYHTYRIPSLIVTAKGALLAFVEGRKDDARDHGDIDLLVKRSTDGGCTWSPQQIVYEEGGTAKITIGNPCPVLDESTGILWLPFCRDNNDVLITKSTDEGLTWSRPVLITSHVKKPGWTWYATGPGVGIQIRRGRYKGRFVIPCDHGAEHEGKLARFSHIFYSDDHGLTWQLGGSADPHTNECQVTECRDGSLLLNMRNHLGRDGGQPDLAGCRAVSVSRDGGASWSPRRLDRMLIEPVCQASLTRYSGTRVLFSNPASETSRVRMTVRLSYDDGKSWSSARVVHDGPSAYSSLAVLRDRTIGLLYERGDARPYERITYARFPWNWLTGK